jgi:type II secretory ATPase GspE/PulE/Tfp pilus assembly ATPase PilB-like protein
MISSPKEIEAALDGLRADEAVIELVRNAAHLPASDLFFRQVEGGVAISARYLGLLRPVTQVTSGRGRHLINAVKANAGMDLAQRHRPLDGRWICTLEDEKKMDLRVSTIPSLYGEAMAIRLLDRSVGLLELSHLGLRQQDHDDLIDWLRCPSGLLLITGPTGAGKTTTTYACLHHLNDGSLEIHTIEDPIEYSIPGVCQSQVNPKIHLDFPELLRGVLRQSPDVIKIGEIRDPITAATAVRAANSGSLVLATLHAPTAPAAIDSMLALGVHPHFLATCLLGVVAQRLVRTLCDKCKTPVEMTGAPHLFDGVKPWLAPGEGQQVYTPFGCEHCHHEGYAARTGVFEMLRPSADIRQFVFEGRSTREIHDKAREDGMLNLRDSALIKVAQGITTTEEVVRAIPEEQLFWHEHVRRPRAVPSETETIDEQSGDGSEPQGT